MSKHNATDEPSPELLDLMANYADAGLSSSDRLDLFVELARDGDSIPPSLLLFVAEGVGRYLEGKRDPWPNPKGRPAGRGRWSAWAIWFAVRCDPTFADQPLTPEGRYRAAKNALRLPFDARQAQNLVREGDADSLQLQEFRLRLFGGMYARRMGWPVTEDTYQRMMEWLPPRK